MHQFSALKAYVLNDDWIRRGLRFNVDVYFGPHVFLVVFLCSYKSIIGRHVVFYDIFTHSKFMAIIFLGKFWGTLEF